MVNKAILLTLINIAGRLINFLLFMIIANRFGLGANTDWFFFNYGIVYFLAGILFNSSEYTLVPIWNKSNKEHHQYIFLKINSYSLIIFILSLIAVFTTAFIISPMIGIHKPGLNIYFAVATCVILSLQPPLSFISSIFSSYMQYEQKYILPTIHLAIRSIGILPIILMNYCNSIFCLSASFLAGETLRLAFLYKRKYFTKPVAVNKISQQRIISHAIKSTIWMTIGLSLVIANPLIDLAMVGRLDEGSVSLVEYAGRLRGLPILAFNGILILLLGEWANQHTKGTLKWKNVSKHFFGSISVASITVIALSFSIDHWINYIFFSAKFTPNDINLLKHLLIYYFLGIPMLIGVFVLTRIMIIYQKFRLFTSISFFAFTLNIALNYLLINIFGINGVAMSTSFVDLFSVTTFYFIVKKILNE